MTREFNFDFIGKMWIFIIISILVVGASLILLLTKGLNYGTDFKGGTKLTYQFDKPVEDGLVRQVLEPLQLGGLSVQRLGSAAENQVVIKLENNEGAVNVASNITAELNQKIPDTKALMLREESVGPKAGAQLRQKAILAIIISWAIMLAYIWFRFDLAFAPGAIVALLHDVIVTIGAFALTGREFSITVVAALMTIIGYSVNDTIVIFDRIRENAPKMLKATDEQLINKSVNETLSRTIITSLTVLIVVTIIYIFGKGEFQDFGFAMMIGVVSGSYSTIYIANPVYLFMKRFLAGKELQKGNVKK